MAIYHCSVNMISRSSGRSSVGSSAYRSGEKITNEYDGVTHDYTNKKGVEYSEIMLPGYAPKEFNDRKILWNEVEKSEKRVNSQTAREVEVALPKELSREEQIYLLKDYVKENFVDKGMCADINLHDKKDGNPHAHIMLTTREVDLTGFTNKNRDWNNKSNLEKWRESWANKTNKRLLANNIHEQITHESFDKQGIEKIPQIHVGPIASAIEKKGKISDRAEMNRGIKKENLEIEHMISEIGKLNKQAIELQKKIEYLQYLEKMKHYNLKREADKAALQKIEQEKPIQIIPEMQIKKPDSKNQIQEKYFSLESEISHYRESLEGYKNELFSAKNYFVTVDSLKKAFNEMDGKRDELIENKSSMKFWNFKQKKELELEIEKYNNSLDQLEDSFKKTFEMDIKDDAAINQFKEKYQNIINEKTLYIKAFDTRIDKALEEMKTLGKGLKSSQIREQSDELKIEKKGIAAKREEIKRDRKIEQDKTAPGKKKTIDRER